LFYLSSFQLSKPFFSFRLFLFLLHLSLSQFLTNNNLSKTTESGRRRRNWIHNASKLGVEGGVRFFLGNKQRKNGFFFVAKQSCGKIFFSL